MTTLTFVRIFFVVICAFIGYYIGEIYGQSLLGVQIGLISAAVLILIESSLKRVSVRGLSSMLFGLLLGVVMANLLAEIITLLPLSDIFHSTSRVILTVVFSYLGAIMALRGKDEFNIIIPYVRFQRQDTKEGVILLDSSAIIDGRIADIHKTHFLAGRLVVPRFVLQELQKIADSADDIKRQRGRRGLEILHAMQEDPKVDVHIHEDDMKADQGVDAKLVTLAKIMDAKICTTDFNLAQSAALQGIAILNVHSLIHAVKSVIFTGEEMSVRLVKEGKEPDQAVAYMEDGTMIVVSDARALIGQTVRVTVNSVLNTQAGKMIFAKLMS